MSVKRVVVMVAICVFSAGMVMGQTEWEPYSDNPVIGLGEPGEWDSGNRQVTGVVLVGSMYHLYFSGYEEGLDDQFSLGHATSTDGVTWTMDPNNPVLTPGAEGEWDDGSVINSAVIYDNAEFHLWYAGWTDDWAAKVGYATSPDGSSWTKDPGNPLFEQGGPGSFDESGVFPRSVVLDGGTYQMWYTGVDLPDYFFTVGYAESTDGIWWTKHPGPVLETGSGWDDWDVSTPSVIFDGSIYHMWYTGGGIVGDYALPTGIGYATSSDGIEWAKYPDNPVFAFDEDHQPESGVVVFDGSAYRMWYQDWVFEGPPTGVWYATSECCVAMNFRQTVPAAALASGAQGSFYQTDVDLNNAGSQAAEYAFTWLPRGENNSDPMTSETFTLGVGMSVRYANVLAEVFDLEPNALGAFSIQSSSPDLLAMSRTYNLETAKSGGTFGQAIPAIKPGEFIERGEKRRILFGSQSEDYRTNVGCVNGTDMLGAVEIELFNAEGTSLKTERLRLDPWSNDQLNAIFSDYAPVNGYVDVWTMLPNGNFYCYGSVLDNVTSDPTTILPQ